MSNLYKGSTVVCDNKDKKLVDSNKIISEKIVKIKEAFEKKQLNDSAEDGFTLGIDAEHVERLLEDENEHEVAADAMSEEHMKRINEKAENILENAKKMAEQIVADAKIKADSIVEEGMKKAGENMRKAVEEGKNKGYAEGVELGERELESRKEELEQYRLKLDREYDDRIKKMEPELVDVLLKIFSEVTKVLAVDKKDLILALVNSVMSGTEVSKNYIIKTNREDAQFLRDNKDRIQGSVGRDITIEIVEDPTMKRNQCLIDTDLGIYDCSLDIQLENLIDNIKILACSSVDYFN
ncbi:MAG: hypothetical protein IIX45_02755 [Lachnospiraceae bacterium]|nr:hypothetical protein [Lachnospiraceae bacterium]